MSYAQSLKALHKSEPVYSIQARCTDPACTCTPGLGSQCTTRGEQFSLTKPDARLKFLSKGWKFTNGHWSCPCCPKAGS